MNLVTFLPIDPRGAVETAPLIKRSRTFSSNMNAKLTAHNLATPVDFSIPCLC